VKKNLKKFPLRKKKIYVWLDALVGYLTAVGYPGSNASKQQLAASAAAEDHLAWPPDWQGLGKI
jgi:methionyl-tRNA synthetase